MAAIVSFIAYLAVPDQGFGGAQAKERFIFSLFLFGAVLVSATPAPVLFRTGLAVFASVFVALNLIATMHALSGYSAAIADYLSAFGALPRGSRIVRVNYSTSDVPIRYGFPGLSRDPLLRVDSDVAAGCHCIDLTDYQALNYIFPIILRPGIDLRQQDRLWHDFEAPGHKTEEKRWIRGDTLGRIDYVIVVADRYSSVNSASFLRMIASLNEIGMQLTFESRRAPFVRVYARDGS